jgi:hypothetical protein
VAQLTRAEDEWFEEVKQELGMEKRWHNYEETRVLIPQAYAQVYAIPSPLDRIFSVSFFSGVTGTATAGGATSITLAAGGDVLGRKIFLTGGTGAGQCNRILSLGGLVATVAATWATGTIRKGDDRFYVAVAPLSGYTLVSGTTYQAWVRVGGVGGAIVKSGTLKAIST